MGCKEHETDHSVFDVQQSEQGREGERERTSLVMEMGNNSLICNMNLVLWTCVIKECQQED